MAEKRSIPEYSKHESQEYVTPKTHVLGDAIPPSLPPRPERNVYKNEQHSRKKAPTPGEPKSRNVKQSTDRIYACIIPDEDNQMQILDVDDDYMDMSGGHRVGKETRGDSYGSMSQQEDADESKSTQESGPLILRRNPIAAAARKQYDDEPKKARPLPTYDEKSCVKECFPTYDDITTKMPCGHAFTAKDLYGFLTVTLASGSVILKCPFEAGGKQCGEEWDYALVCKAAGVADEEMRRVEHRMSEISLSQEGIRQCPRCNMRCMKERGGRRVRCVYCQRPFCWDCLQDWHPRGQYGCGKSESSIF